MSPRLSEIKSYQMWIKHETEEESTEIHRALMTVRSSLKELEVYYEPCRVLQASHKLFVDISSTFANGVRFPRLNNPTLWSFDMRQCSSSLLERFEISKLPKLYLLDCSSSSVFMTCLSVWYIKNSGLLDTFQFRYPCHLSFTTRTILSASLERFVTVCSSLSRIIIEYRGNAVIPVTCTTKYGKTLRSLRMGMDAWPERRDTVELYRSTYPVRDREAILHACQNLGKFGFDMPFDAVTLGFISDSEPSFELARQTTNERHALPEFEDF
jgi:hypothetical protein